MGYTVLRPNSLPVAAGSMLARARGAFLGLKISSRLAQLCFRLWLHHSGAHAAPGHHGCCTLHSSLLGSCSWLITRCKPPYRSVILCSCSGGTCSMRTSVGRVIAIAGYCVLTLATGLASLSPASRVGTDPLPQRELDLRYATQNKAGLETQLLHSALTIHATQALQRCTARLGAAAACAWCRGG